MGTIILTDDRQLGPFPMHRLKQVDKPTTLVTDSIQRIDRRNIAFLKAARGDYGPAVQKNNERFRDKLGPLTHAIIEVSEHLSAIKPNEVAASKAPLPENPNTVSRHIKSFGYFLGADCIGICHLPAHAVYSHNLQGNPINIHYKYAVVIVSSKHYPTAAASMGYDWIADPISHQAYQHSAFIAQTMANYIRRLGYLASAQHGPNNYEVQLPPLLLWAGIGEVSRLGIILNPFLGLNFKASAVLTDLPLAPDKPVDFGLQDFCRRCKKCAENCPSKAISMGNKAMYNGYETWKHNDQRCFSFITANEHGNFCNLCAKVCPWTRPNTWPHNLVRWVASKSSLGRILAIKGDRLSTSRTRGHEDEKWWFDLIYKNGEVKEP